MSTRSRIKLMYNGKALGGIYYAMDGHTWNFAPPLIKALKATTPENILMNKHLIKFMGANALNAYGERDEHLDYLCEVDVSQPDYMIKLTKWGKSVVFNGTLDAFTEEYGEKDD